MNDKFSVTFEKLDAYGRADDMKTVIAEHNGDGMWRYVIFDRGAVVAKSAYRYESDLEAKYAGNRAI